MIWPLSGCSRPLTRLTSVVLPAPFEPISASTSPSLTLKSTASTARLSPKDFANAWVARRFMSTRSFPLGGQLLDRAHDPGGQHQDQRDEHCAEQQLPVNGESNRVSLQIGEGHRAD